MNLRVNFPTPEFEVQDIFKTQHKEEWEEFLVRNQKE
jgi:hypothetical protein